MKKIVKNTTVVALSGVMAIGMLSGCGSKSIDGEKTVATVDGTDIPMGVVSLYARESQAQTVAMYKSFMGSAGNIWSQVVDEDAGTTYGEQAVGQFLEQVELMYIMKEKAADYGVEVTSDDETAIADAAAQFMQDNDEDTLKELAVSEDQVKTLLELETYRQRIYDPIRNEAEGVGPWFKCNMTDVVAALGLIQFERYPEMLAKRKEMIERMNTAFADLNVAVLNHYGENHCSSGHLYIVRLLGKTREQTNEVIKRMAERGIATNVHYKPLPMMTAYKKMGFDIKDFPNAYHMFENEITLPLNTKMSTEDVDYVIENFVEIVGLL